VKECAAGFGIRIRGQMWFEEGLLMEGFMKNKPQKVLLSVSSILMLLAALPMVMWCLELIRSASMNNDYSTLGLFVAGIVYVFSMITAIAGLVFAKKPHRYLWCRVLGYIQLIAGVLLIVPIHIYTVLALPPLFLLTVLYLFGLGWREKRDFEHS
jgi:hypothetical protein